MREFFDYAVPYNGKTRIASVAEDEVEQFSKMAPDAQRLYTFVNKEGRTAVVPERELEDFYNAGGDKMTRVTTVGRNDGKGEWTFTLDEIGKMREGERGEKTFREAIDYDDYIKNRHNTVEQVAGAAINSVRNTAEVAGKRAYEYGRAVVADPEGLAATLNRAVLGDLRADATDEYRRGREFFDAMREQRNGKKWKIPEVVEGEGREESLAEAQRVEEEIQAFEKALDWPEGKRRMEAAEKWAQKHPGQDALHEAERQWSEEIGRKTSRAKKVESAEDEKMHAISERIVNAVLGAGKHDDWAARAAQSGEMDKDRTLFGDIMFQTAQNAGNLGSAALGGVLDRVAATVGKGGPGGAVAALLVKGAATLVKSGMNANEAQGFMEQAVAYGVPAEYILGMSEIYAHLSGAIEQHEQIGNIRIGKGKKIGDVISKVPGIGDIIEKIPGKLNKAIAGQAWGMAKQGLSEAGEEVAQNGLQLGLSAIMLNRWMDAKGVNKEEWLAQNADAPFKIDEDGKVAVDWGKAREELIESAKGGAEVALGMGAGGMAATGVRTARRNSAANSRYAQMGAKAAGSLESKERALQIFAKMKGVSQFDVEAAQREAMDADTEAGGRRESTLENLNSILDAAIGDVERERRRVVRENLFQVPRTEDGKLDINVGEDGRATIESNGITIEYDVEGGGWIVRDREGNIARGENGDLQDVEAAVSEAFGVSADNAASALAGVEDAARAKLIENAQKVTGVKAEIYANALELPEDKLEEVAESARAKADGDETKAAVEIAKLNGTRFKDGSVAVFTDNIGNVGQLYDVLWHKGNVHNGISRAITDKVARNKLFKEISRNVDAMTADEVNARIEEVKDGTRPWESRDDYFTTMFNWYRNREDIGEDDYETIEECLAYLSQGHALNTDPKANKIERGLWRVRSWLRSAGLPVAVTEEDYRLYLNHWAENKGVPQRKPQTPKAPEPKPTKAKTEAAPAPATPTPTAPKAATEAAPEPETPVSAPEGATDLEKWLARKGIAINGEGDFKRAAKAIMKERDPKRRAELRTALAASLPEGMSEGDLFPAETGELPVAEQPAEPKKNLFERKTNEETTPGANEAPTQSENAGRMGDAGGAARTEGSQEKAGAVAAPEADADEGGGTAAIATTAQPTGQTPQTDAQDFDAKNGTQTADIVSLAGQLRGGKKPQSQNRFFKLAKATDELKTAGLTGDYFTIREGVVLRHDGKDENHAITPEEWLGIAKGLSDPILIEKFKPEKFGGKSFRIWLNATIGGENAVVGAVVKSVGRNIEINSVTTVFGATDATIKAENIVYDKRSRSERERALLTGHNSRTYRVVSERDSSLPQSDEKSTPAAAQTPKKPIETREEFINRRYAEARNYAKRNRVSMSKAISRITKSANMRKELDAKWQAERGEAEAKRKAAADEKAANATSALVSKFRDYTGDDTASDILQAGFRGRMGILPLPRNYAQWKRDHGLWKLAAERNGNWNGQKADKSNEPRPGHPPYNIPGEYDTIMSLLDGQKMKSPMMEFLFGRGAESRSRKNTKLGQRGSEDLEDTIVDFCSSEGLPQLLKRNSDNTVNVDYFIDQALKAWEKWDKFTADPDSVKSKERIAWEEAEAERAAKEKAEEEKARRSKEEAAAEQQAWEANAVDLESAMEANDAEFAEALAFVEGRNGHWHPFTRRRLSELRHGDLVSWDGETGKYEFVSYDAETGRLVLHTPDVEFVTPEGHVGGEDRVFEITEDGWSEISDNLGEDENGGEQTTGQANGETEVGGEASASTAAAPRSDDIRAGNAQGEEGRGGGGATQGGDFALESVSNEEIEAEKRRRAERAEIEKRQNAPLTGDAGEVGQTLLDLGGEKGEDLLNRTERAEQPAADAQEQNGEHAPDGEWHGPEQKIYKVSSDRIKPTKGVEPSFGGSMSTAMLSTQSIAIDGIPNVGYVFHDVRGLNDVNFFYLFVNPAMGVDIERLTGKAPEETEGDAWEIAFSNEEDLLSAFDKLAAEKDGAAINYSGEALKKLRAYNEGADTQAEPASAAPKTSIPFRVGDISLDSGVICKGIIPARGQSFSEADIAAINAALAPQGLSASIGEAGSRTLVVKRQTKGGKGGYIAEFNKAEAEATAALDALNPAAEQQPAPTAAKEAPKAAQKPQETQRTIPFSKLRNEEQREAAASALEKIDQLVADVEDGKITSGNATGRAKSIVAGYQKSIDAMLKRGATGIERGNLTEFNEAIEKVGKAKPVKAAASAARPTSDTANAAKARSRAIAGAREKLARILSQDTIEDMQDAATETGVWQTAGEANEERAESMDSLYNDIEALWAAKHPDAARAFFSDQIGDETVDEDEKARYRSMIDALDAGAYGAAEQRAAESRIADRIARKDSGAVRFSRSDIAKQGALSGGTSRNQNPSGNRYAARVGIFRPGTRNVDIGAGRFDKATEFLAGLGVQNIPFDPVNRGRKENERAAQSVRDNPADTATIHNVLNVIDNDAVMEGIINQAARAIKKDGTAVFSIYEGDRSGNGKATRDGYRRNARTKDYLPAIGKFFGDVEQHGEVIVAKNPKDVGPAFWAFDENFEDGVRFSRGDVSDDVRKAFANDPETRNWTIATNPSVIANLPPQALKILPPVTERTDNNSVEKAMKQLFTDFGEVRNIVSGERVVFNRADAGKMMMQSGADMRTLSPHLKALFENAVPAWSETPLDMPGHREHKDVVGYHNYVAKFIDANEIENFVRFTVREQKSGRQGVHAATVSEVAIYKNAEGTSAPANKSGEASRIFVDKRLSKFLGKVKENSGDGDVRFSRSDILNRPAVDTVQAIIDARNASVAGPAPGIMDRPESRLEKLRRATQDAMLPVKSWGDDLGLAAKDNPYYAEDRRYGKDEHQTRELFRTKVAPILDECVKRGVALSDLNAYMNAVFAPERNKMISDRTAGVKSDGAGLSDIEAAAIEAEYKKRGMTADLDAIAQMVWTMNNETLDRLVDAGLLADAQAKTWKKLSPHYVPLRTMLENEDYDETAVSAAITRLESKHALGRATVATNPLIFSILQAEQAILRANKNEVRKMVAEAVRANPQTGIILNGQPVKKTLSNGMVRYTVDRQFREKRNVKDFGEDNVIQFKEDGQLKYIVLNGERGKLIARAITHYGMQGIEGKVGETIQRANRWLANTRTSWSPTFLLRNLGYDTQQVATTMNMDGLHRASLLYGKFVATGSALRAAHDYYKHGTYGGELGSFMKEFVENGGLIKGGTSQGWNETSSYISEGISDRLAVAGAGKAWRSFRDRFERANSSIETQTRLACYAALRKAGWGVEEAISYARDVTVNFNRKGEYGQIINNWWMFANAGIQDMERIARSLLGNEARRHGSRNGAAVGRIATVSALVALGIIQALGGDDDDDDEMDNMTDYSKQSSWYRRFGKTGYYLRIGRRGPYNLIPYAAQRLTEVHLGKATIEDAAADIGEMMFAIALDPANSSQVMRSSNGRSIDIVDTVLNTAAPTLGAPIIQMATDRTFTGELLTRKRYNENLPASMNGKEGTASLAKWTAKSLNAITGGDEYTPGKLDIPPEYFELLASSIYGSLGADAIRTFSTAMDIANGDINPERMPAIRDLVRKIPDNTSRYYEAMSRQKGYETSANGYKTAKDWTRRREFIKEHPTVSDGMAKRLRDAAAHIKKLRELEANQEGEVAERTRKQRLRKQARYIELMGE